MGALTIEREDDVAGVIGKFDATFGRLGTVTSVSAIVVLSGKPDVFIAGADIEEFVSIQTREAAEHLLDKLESLALPHGDRFAPAERSVEMARTGKRFYK